MGCIGARLTMSKKSAKLQALEAELTKAELILQDLLEVKVIHAQQAGFPNLAELLKRIKNHEAT